VTRYLVVFRDLLFRNFSLKLTSLLLSLLLWIALNGEPKSEVAFKIPLEFRNTPSKVEVLSDSVNMVDIRVLATSSLVKRINPSEISAIVNLSNWSLGERTYQLTGENIRLPFGAIVTKITPNKIRLRFEPTHQKSVEIRPRVVGRPAAGYGVALVSCVPPRAEIEGPASHLENIQFVYTDSVDITDRYSKVDRSVQVYAEDPIVRIVKQQEVLVEVNIIPQ
jgi:hypothetical protein